MEQNISEDLHVVRLLENGNFDFSTDTERLVRKRLFDADKFFFSGKHKADES